MEFENPVLVDPGTAFSLVGLMYVLLAIGAGVHVVLHKQNEGAAFSWLGIIVLAPLIGALLYWLFGINRIRRRAQAELPARQQPPLTAGSVDPAVADELPEHWQGLMRVGAAIHRANYLPGNTLTPLINGDEAYPRMLDAIARARHSVVLSSYIFEFDRVGRRFVDALVAARERGVAVRVMIDGVGVGYGFSLVRADRVLRARGVRTARFLATLSTSGTRFINLRNHRKILSIDGERAFVGGMNIRQGNELARPSRHATQDVHFEIRGPVIDQINAVFADDWQFSSGEILILPHWPGEADDQSDGASDDTLAAESAGEVLARVLLDGPDDNYQKLQLTIVAAVNAAREQVRVVTPYFLPDRTVLNALQLASLRGVSVDILVPAKNNLPFVHWAMLANLKALSTHGIRLHCSSPPFDHSKLFMVDERWSLIGSSNWDSRSLELNFEINIECFDVAFNAHLNALFDDKCRSARQVQPPRREPLITRLRNNFFRLFSPYL